MEKKFYTAKYDRVFKTVLCDEENPHLLQEFLSRILKKKIEIAKSMLKEKLPLETISRCTNLTIEEINNLN